MDNLNLDGGEKIMPSAIKQADLTKQERYDLARVGARKRPTNVPVNMQVTPQIVDKELGPAQAPLYKILFKIASRGRPKRLKETLDSIMSNIANKQDYETLLSLDSNDPLIPEYEQIKDSHSAVFGESKNKIDAINRDIDKAKSRWDILVNVSDDQLFLATGFDDIIRRAFGGSLDRFLQFPIGKPSDCIAVLSIIGRPYYERFGYIYHPSYKSLWCDLDATDVAVKLGKRKYVNLKIFEHNHPALKGPKFNDDRYKETESYYWEDGRNFLKRQKQGFPTNSDDVIRIDIKEMDYM